MLGNFSVEWLSQSIHTMAHCGHQDGEEDAKLEHIKPHVPRRPSCACRDVLVLPKTQKKASLQKEEIMDVLNPSSPTVSDSCGDSSGYESETQSPGRPSPEEEEGEGSRRRTRTKFTSDQICRLEKTFNRHKYLGATERAKIAEKLQLSETQVKTWFQNRRMKLKREVQDMRAEYLSPGLLPRLALPASAWVQHHSLPGQHLPPARFSPALAALYPPLMPHIPGTPGPFPPAAFQSLLFPANYY
ncbi:homeobox protein vent1-like [Amia ocellicauda]|uniref:homeobox protein vent1-like n=1 Tax=Amia ocellicauda TaxID=2972642 RepID=UPI003463E550|nr:VENT1 protein [Amia calva]